MSTERRCADCGGHAAGEDRFCAGCGLPLPVVDGRTETALAGGPLLLDADLTDRAGRLGLDFGAIWIADLLVPTRIERAFVDLDCLTLADAAALPADAQRRMWSVGAKSIADLREAVAAVVADADRWRAIVSARTGDWNDPRAPALPPAVRKVARERAIDLSQVSLAQLDLTPRLVSVVGQGQFRTVDDLRRLTNADLRRRLGVFQHEAHPALREALEAWAAEVSAGAPPVSLVGAELDARDPVTPPPSLQHLIASAETALGRIAASLSSLPERERGIVMARYGLDGMPSQTLEDIGRRLGISRARVSQIEQAATRRSGPVAAAIRVARDTLAALRERLLLGGDDPRFAAALCGAGMPERQIAGLLALADESAPHDPVASAGQRLDEAAIAALARWGPLPLSEAARRIGEAIGEDGLPRLDQAAIGERLRVVGPGLVGPDDHVDLPPVPSSLPNDKRIRRLNALIGVLERLGPSHYDEVAAALSVRLPAEYALDAGDVHAWLLRYSDVFAWVGKGRFGLREDGFGHREPVEAGDGRAVRQRKGVGDEIVTLLLERGPLPEDEVVAHLLQRFRVRPESISVAIRYDRRHRFAIDASGLVGLVAHAGADRPDVASSTGSASDPAAPPHPIGS